MLSIFKKKKPTIPQEAFQFNCGMDFLLSFLNEQKTNQDKLIILDYFIDVIKNDLQSEPTYCKEDFRLALLFEAAKLKYEIETDITKEG